MRDLTIDTPASRLEQTVAWGLTAVWMVLVAILAIVTGQFHAHHGALLANEFAVPNWVMRKVARRLVNNCVFAGNVNRSYDDEYSQKGVKMGDTVTARLPVRYEVTIGAKMNPTPLNDQTVTITITDQTNIGIEYDSWSATLYVDDYMERYGNPAVDQLINNIDYTGLSRCYSAVAKTTGTPGVIPGSTGTLPQSAMQPYADAQAKLFDSAAPTPYNAMLSSFAHSYLTTGTAALFNPAAQIAANFRKGQFGGDALGIDRWFKTQNVPSHTVGAQGGTVLVNGVPTEGSAAIVCDGASNSVTNWGTLGDVIQFAGCYDINPLSHDATDYLKDFTLTQAESSDGSGNITFNISPAMITSGPYAVCSALPANNAAVTVFGSASAYANKKTRQALVYHSDAFALVMADLVLPRGLWVAERISNAKLGISIRFLKDHDIINDVSPARLDTAHGWKAVRQELACRVCVS